MTSRATAGFTYHSPDFKVPAPEGYAECQRCHGLITLETFTAESCPGLRPLAEPAMLRPVRPGGLRCVLCGEPVHADPMHRAILEWFGATCNACFDGEAVHV